MIKRILNLLSSSLLALVLVLLVILFSLAGAILPQQTRFDPADIELWQQAHPVVTGFSQPLGLFDVFHSWPFLATILILGVNTLTCTVFRFFREGGLTALRGPESLRITGFLLLHLSLVLLLIAAFWNLAASLDGYIILTEGQTFKETHEGYMRLAEGRFRPEHHQQFSVVLKKIETQYQQKKYQVDVAAKLQISSNDKKLTDGVVKFNEPCVYEGVSFTLKETGFSPRLTITDSQTGRVMVNSFLALETLKTDDGRQYRDFLPLKFLENTIILTLYPGHTEENGKITKTSEQPDNPILVVVAKDQTGKEVERKYLRLNDKITMGKQTFGFTDLRQWAAFAISEDPAYPIMQFSFWLAVAALLLRYLPDLRIWFSEKPSSEDSF